MSKETKRRQDKNEVEHLRGIVREKEKLIRQLTKRLKHLEKRSHIEIIAEPEEPIEIVKKTRCDECFKGYFDEFEILGKVYGTCSIPECGHRKRLK